jgi:glycosyltransferase involved in cell wall biosynthesis
MAKTTVIHIMTHPPAYDEYSDKPRPEWNWDISNSLWVGIWGYDWADQLAIEVKKVNKIFDHEIWQPDLRADRIYNQEIFPGVIHRLFPAQEKSKLIGLRKNCEVSSPAMIQFLSAEEAKKVIFHIGQSVTCKINKDLLESFINAKFIFSFHGQITLPIISLLRIQKNILAKFHYLNEHFLSKKLFNQLSFLTFQNNRNLAYLKYYYNGPLKRITMGIHFDDFHKLDKVKCREELNLPQNSIILLTICRLYELKQIDKIIEVLSKIDRNFLYIIVGHGTREYEEFLIKKSEKLRKQNKVLLTGYKKGPELLKYLNASDLFIHVSKSEAGPVVCMEAMASGLPLFCTGTGNIAEVLKENNAGIVVGIKNYKNWKKEIINYLDGKPIKTLDPDFIKEQYDWGNIANKFIAIYDKVKL